MESCGTSSPSIRNLILPIMEGSNFEPSPKK
jgi:hypothetical protein